jgi:hypothetical protein
VGEVVRAGPLRSDVARGDSQRRGVDGERRVKLIQLVGKTRVGALDIVDLGHAALAFDGEQGRRGTGGRDVAVFARLKQIAGVAPREVRVVVSEPWLIPRNGSRAEG